MGWQTYPAKAMFPAFAQDWDRLNGELYNSHPYFDSRFVGPLLDCFANGKERLCIHRTNGVVSGALILQYDGLGRWSSFRPSQAQVTAVLLDDVVHLESLLKALPGLVWTIEFYAIDPRYSPDFSHMELANIVSAHAHTIGIHPDIGFTDYWDKRSKDLKASIRKYYNRFAKDFCPPSFSKSTDHTDMKAGVTRFGDLETAGWKGAAGTAVSSGNVQGQLYSEILGRFALTNQAAVYELRVGDRLAASQLAIANDHMVVLLKTSYDESLARFAPGRILLYLVIQEQLRLHPEKTIEFYTNATREQTEWTTFGCAIQNIQIFKSNFFATAFSVLKTIRRKPIEFYTNAIRGQAEWAIVALKSALTHAPYAIPPEGEVHQAQVLGYKSVSALAAVNCDLHQFSAEDNIESSIDWFDLLQQNVYPHDTGVRYYVVTESNRPSTILPLRLVTKGRIRSIEALGNYYTSLYTPLHATGSDPLALQDALSAATREHVNAHVMRFAPMDPKSADYEHLMNGIRGLGWIPFSFFCFGNWFLSVSGGWEDYLIKRSANLRSSIKRRNKYFDAEGGTLEVVTSTDMVEQSITAFQDVYSASWKIPEPYPDFVPSLIRRLASQGRLRLGIARLRGRAIAAQIWIVGQDKASIYKVAYDEAFAAYSPGTVLTGFLMQHVIEHDQVKEVDFLIGDDKYKQVWMSNRRERWGIIAYNPRTLIGFALFVKEATQRVVKQVLMKSKLLKPELSGRSKS